MKHVVLESLFKVLLLVVVRRKLSEPPLTRKKAHPYRNAP
ncbi:hypothetical protein, hydrolase [Marinobacter nauticus ATCC 49840]|nr:hypothetical protein, hydrolase [Marinobacter nauticus ATCC 49840]